jgi:hypothetical protein
MVAVAAFIWEEGLSHIPLVEIPGNLLLFQPAYQIPFIQHWLDAQFTVVDADSLFVMPLIAGIAVALSL